MSWIKKSLRQGIEGWTPVSRMKKKKNKKNPPRRGIEPRSPAWQAGILTTILSRIDKKRARNSSIWISGPQFVVVICCHESWWRYEAERRYNSETITKIWNSPETEKNRKNPGFFSKTEFSTNFLIFKREIKLLPLLHLYYILGLLVSKIVKLV